MLSTSPFFDVLYLAAILVSFVACLALTPLIRRAALWLNLVDEADNHRKLHKGSIPLGGGVAILLSFLLMVGIFAVFSDSQHAELTTDSRFTIGLSLAAVFICLVGLVDDRVGLRGRQKLVAQIAASLIIVASGLVIDGIAIFGFSMHLGFLAIPFTVCWLLGAMNALNLLDGIDGLATSVGIVLSLAIAALAILTDNRTEACFALAMAGSLLGFLFYNSPPASIFLGDAGSMLIGLVLGALAIRAAIKGPATVALAAPTAIWAIPFFDVGVAILRRKLTGRSLYTGDRGHLHHILQRRGNSSRRTVVIIGTLCAITAVAAVISAHMANELFAISAVAAVCGILVVAGIFGRSESLLLVRRAKQFVRSLIPMISLPSSDLSKLETRLQGDHQWGELWETLTQFAERFDLNSVQLSVYIPALNEDYHASWRRRERTEETGLWHSEIPLSAEDRTVGHLKISGACPDGSVCIWMADLIAGLQPFETQMLELVSDCNQRGSTTQIPPEVASGKKVASRKRVASGE